MLDAIHAQAVIDGLNETIREQAARINQLESELSGYRRAATIVPPPRDTLPSPRLSFDGPVDWDDSPLLGSVIPRGQDGDRP